GQSCSHTLLTGNRQAYADYRALTRLAVDGNRAAVLLDKLLDGGQAETGAEAFGAEQRLEYARQYIGCYSWCRIAHGNFKLVRNSRCYTDLVLSPSARGALLDGLHRIIDQIDDHATEPVGVKIDNAVGRGQVPLKQD